MATGCSPALPARSRRRRRRDQLETTDPFPSGDGETGLLPPGTEVEVRRDGQGYYGTWCEATIVHSPSAPAGSSVVTFDGRGSRQFAVAPTHVRPRPPARKCRPGFRFHRNDVVEAFHGGGWWSGLILSAGPRSVTVAFPITREVKPYIPGLVRPRRDFTGGAWVPSRVAVVVRPSRAVRVYVVGDKVEVLRQRDAFGESWFPATVIVVVDDLTYVVEYLDVEEEGEKATEYLLWKFIRPAVERTPGPGESEFQFVPGAAVEAYCDGAWSPGVVRRVLSDGESEIGIVPKKDKTELLVTKVVSLLRPQYKWWNGRQWRIATPTNKEQANSRRWSVSGKSLVEVLSVVEEHNLGKNTLAEGCEHVSVSEIDITTSALCKSLERTHSPNSVVSEKNSPQGSHGIVMNGLCAFAGHSAPVDNQEILSDMVVTDGELNGRVSGRNVDGCGILSITELRKKKALGRRNSAANRIQENLAKSLRVKKCISDIKAGKTHPIQKLQGKIQLKGNMNFSSSDTVLPLSVSGNGRTILSPDILVPVGTKRGSMRKVLSCKKLANTRGSKGLCSLNSSLDVTRTVQQGGRKEVAEPMEECPLTNLTELSNQDLLPMLPPGFKSTDNGKSTNIHHTDAEPTGMTCLIEPKGNGDVCTDYTVTESNHVMETAILSLNCLAEQAPRKVDERSVSHNAGSSQCIIDNSLLRSCSASESLLPSPPHFLSEGMSLGMMVSFTDLVKIIMEGSIDKSMEWFNDRIKTISHLEENVQFMKNAMSKLVKIKSEHTNYHGEIGKLDLKFVEKTDLSSRLAALLVEHDIAAAKLEQELGHIRQESRQIALEKEKIDAEAAGIKTARSGYKDLCSAGESKFNDVMCALQRKMLP